MGGRVPLNFGQRLNPAAQARGGNAAPRLNAGRPLLNLPNPFRRPNIQLPFQPQRNPLLQLIALLNQIANVIRVIQQQQQGFVGRPGRPAPPPRVQPAPPNNNRPAPPPRGFDDFWKISDQTQRDIDAYRPRVVQTTGIMDQVRNGTPIADVLKTVPDHYLSLITPRPTTSSMVTSLTAAVQLVDQTTANLNDRITVLNQLLPFTRDINDIDTEIQAKQQDVVNAENALRDYQNTFNTLDFDINTLWRQRQTARLNADDGRVKALNIAIANRLNNVVLPSGERVILPFVDPESGNLGADVNVALQNLDGEVRAKEALLAQQNGAIDLLNQERNGIEQRQADAALLLGIPFDDNAKAFLADATNLHGAIQALGHAKATLPKDMYDQGLADAKALLQYGDAIEREWQRRRNGNLPDPGIRPAPPIQVAQADIQPLPLVDPVPPRVVVQANPIPIPDAPVLVNHVNVNFQPDPPQVVVITPSATPLVNNPQVVLVSATPTPTVLVASRPTVLINTAIPVTATPVVT